MRKIIWRGRKPDGVTWVYGDLCQRNPDGRVYIRVHDSRANAGRAVKLSAVDADTVGEWTGITDCNGTPIFEGDVCEIWWSDCEPEDVAHIVVKWSECGFYIAEDGTPDEPLEMGASQCVRVIGNIHDSPECAAWHGCATCIYSESWMEDFDGVYRCDYCDTLTGRRGNCPYWNDGTLDDDDDDFDDDYFGGEHEDTEARQPSTLARLLAGMIRQKRKD